MATAVAPVAEVSTALGAGGGAGASAGASDGSERQWRMNVKGEWTIANVKPAGSDADKDDSDSAGDVIHVHDLASGTVYTVAVTPTELGESILAKVCKASGQSETAVSLIFRGAQLSPSLPASKILEAGGKLGMITSDTELLFDPSNKSEHVTLSSNQKEMYAKYSDCYCYEKNNVMATNPFGSGVSEFTLQLTGTDSGCYDAIGLVTSEFDVNEQVMGMDDKSWCFQTCYGQSRHAGQTHYHNSIGYCNQKTICKFTLDRGAGTLSMCRTKNSDDFESVEQIFDNITPGIELFLCVNTCGHDGRPKFRIIDDNSPPLARDATQDSDESEY